MKRAAMAVAALLICGSIEAAPKPNVLFIAIDDLNNWAAGLSEYGDAKTPHIDRLTQRGVLFTNAHCAAPACNPSRASVMTGVAPSTSGVYFNWQDWRECRNLKGITTLPAYFRNHGYKVLGGGKLYHAANLSEWALAGYLDPEPWRDYFPSKTRQLADEFVPPGHAINGSNKHYGGRLDWNALDIDDSQMGDGEVVAWAEQQLSLKHDSPLFLAIGLYRPHIPWYTPKKWFDEYPLASVRLPKIQADDLDDVPAAGQEMARRAWQSWIAGNRKWDEAVQAYLASVSFADAMVGRLLKALDDGPHAENTVIVLWSDHGYHLGHKEHWEKFALWEQTTQVPLIVVETNSRQRAARCSRPVSLLDIYPTLVELCGLKPLDHLDGASLTPLLKTPDAKSDRVVVTTQGFKNHAARSQHWRYIRYSDGAEELYDHRQDPHEFDNLAKNEKYNDLKARLASHLPQLNSPPHPAERPRRP